MQQQEQELISLIESYRDRECDSLIAQAQHKRKELVHNAHHEARERLHKAVERERPRALLRIRTAEAELHTKKRAVKQRNAQALIREGWKLLTEGLQQRWTDDNSRRAWIDLCVTAALDNLPAKHWTVSHPSDCDMETLDYFKDLVTEQSAEIVIEMQKDANVTAGLVIDSGASRLDMSLNGLLKDRASLEARMLALFSRSEQA